MFLRQVPVSKIAKMKQYGLFYYNKYFSNIEKIVNTSIQVRKITFF